jgi:molybdopterin converting factor small subunit
MAVTVLIPAALRSRAHGHTTLASEGSTLDEVLNELARDYAELVAVIRKEGALCGFVNVYHNDTNVRYGKGLGTVLADGDVIRVLPAVAGG